MPAKKTHAHVLFGRWTTPNLLGGGSPKGGYGLERLSLEGRANPLKEKRSTRKSIRLKGGVAGRVEAFRSLQRKSQELRGTHYPH